MTETDPQAAGAARDPRLSGAIRLFDEGDYLASHELFEELWEATSGPDSDFYKGMIQAAIALLHFKRGNVAGARKLYADHRRFLAGYMPEHLGIDVRGFLGAMQTFLTPALRARPGEEVPFDESRRPRIDAGAPG